MHIKLNKKTRKTIKRGAILTIFISLLLFILIFFMSIKLHFFLSDEIDITLTPRHITRTVPNDEEITFNFTITNNNFRQCQARCMLSLINKSDGTTISDEEVVFQHGETLSRTYTIGPVYDGRGQDIFSFDVECRNIPTLVCLTSQKPQFATAIISRNYEYTDAEVEIRERVGQKLDDVLD